MRLSNHLKKEIKRCKEIIGRDDGSMSEAEKKKAPSKSHAIRDLMEIRRFLEKKLDRMG